MRVLFTTLPGAGPLHPLVPLVLALQQAGHTVAFATAAAYCPTIERYNVPCFAAGLDYLVSEVGQIYEQLRVERGNNAPPFSPLRDAFGSYLPERMLPDLVEIVQTWRPDLLVRDPMEFAGCIAAERAGIPHLAAGPLFMFWDSAWHHHPGEVVRPNHDPLRDRYGLPPDPCLTALYRYGYLATLPSSFVGQDCRVPSTVRFVRPVSVNTIDRDTLPASVTRLKDRPLVHASLGTIFHRTPGVFETILDGIRDEPINLVLAIGRDQDPERFGPQPPNVVIERYIPHNLLLPKCDLVITHGGFSSVMVALEHGLPMVLIPLAGGDQPGNAARCAELGVGVVVGPKGRTAEAIRDAVRMVLSDARFYNRSKAIRDEIQALPDPAMSVNLLQDLLTDAFSNRRALDPTCTRNKVM